MLPTMKRLRRWLFNLAAGAFLLICIFFLALWIRSQSTQDVLSYVHANRTAPGEQRWNVFSINGSVTLVWQFSSQRSWMATTWSNERQGSGGVTYATGHAIYRPD